MPISEYVKELVVMLRKLLEDEKIRGDVAVVEYSAKEVYIEFRKGLFRTRWDAVRMYEEYRSCYYDIDAAYAKRYAFFEVKRMIADIETAWKRGLRE